ncbi:neuroblast differentiation-associated protein AHNAK-like [Scyliorhinus canicula]|uniref:neuroblast differentiation-associated protein AHNAK-like n=1 Tax=Scyliorhinus canicula TaxID=7830 RepID=UPI0018F59940|nr:neuroblast differentiation-associated protein AHNAK-like [Scyliorhinus canicula]
MTPGSHELDFLVKQCVSNDELVFRAFDVCGCVSAGDQLLSAKVYFDNAKYEDVMKILQSAEPYKVAFCLKRTVPSADVAISSETGNLELKGPEAKKTKLSVKSISPVKKTKKLMKGKILSKEEADVELDVPVDVEFAFPKFSTFKKLTITSPSDAAALKGEARLTHPEVGAELALGEGQVKDKKKKLTFPGLWARESGKAKADVSVKPPEPKGAATVRLSQVRTKELEGAGVGVKTEAKVPILNWLTKSKKGKGDVPISKAKTELKVSGGAEGEAPEGKLGLGIPAKAPKVEIDIGLPKAELDVKGPSVDGDANAKGLGFKLKMPSFGLKDGEAVDTTGPKVKVESKEAVKGPSVDGDANAKGLGFKLKMPSFGLKDGEAVDITGPKVREAVGEVEGPEGKLKMPQISMPSIDISVPKMKQTEEVDVAPRGVEIVIGSYKAEGLEGKVKELAQKITTIDISAPKVKAPDFDISLPKGKADHTAARVDVKPPDISIEGPEAKLKMPKVSLPEFSISAKSKEGREMEVEGPGVKGPMLEMPKFKISLPKVKLGEGEADGSPPKTEARVKVPVSQVQVSKAKMDIRGLQVEGPEAKIKLPSVKMPTIDIAMPKVTIPDVQLPAYKGEVSSPGIAAGLQTSKVSIGGPKVEGQRPEASSEGFDLKLKMPKVSLPKFDISASGKEAEAKVGGKLEADGEDAKFKGMKMPKFEVSLPKMKHAEVEADLRAESDASGPGFGILGKLPAVKMPTIDISAPEMKIPDVHLPAGKAEVIAPSVVGGVKTPKVSIGVPKMDSQPGELSPEPPALQLKMPKVSLPTFGLSASGKEVAGEVHGPEVDIKGKVPSLKMPTIDISAPEVKIPEMDINVCLPKENAEIADIAVGGDGKVPRASVKSQISQMPGIALTGPDATFQMPKVSLPKFEISVKGKEAGADVDVKAGDGLEIGGPDGKVKSAQLKMPKFEVALPKLKPGEVDVSGPTVDIKSGKRDGKASKGEADTERVESSTLKLKLPSMKMPTIDIPALQTEILEVDLGLPSVKSTLAAAGERDSHPAGVSSEGADVKVKMPKLSLPKFGSKSKEADGSVSKVEGKASSPAAKGKGKAPGVDIKGPSVDPGVDDETLKGKEFKLKMPKFKMPTFGTSKKYEDGVDISIPGARGPGVDKGILKGRVEVKGAEVEAEGKVKSAFMKTSKFGMSAFKSKSLEAEVSLPSETSLPKGKIEVKDPGASGKAPKVAVSSKADLATEGPDIKLKMPSFTMPNIGILGPKVEAELEVGTKSATLDTELEGSGSKLKMPSIQMPSIEISVPPVKQVDAEGLLPRPEVDVSEVDLKTYGGDLKIPKVKGQVAVPDLEEKQKLPSVKMPSVDISVPRVKAPDVDLGLSVPKVDTSVRKAEGEVALLTSEPEDLEFKLKMPKFGMPKFGLPGSRERESAAEVSASVDYHVEDTEGKGMMFKAKMPKVDISFPKVKQSEVDVDMDASLLEVEEPDAEGKFKMPGFSLPKFSPPKLVAPDIDLDITLSRDKKVAHEATGPKTDTQTAGGEFKIKMPQVSLSGFGTSTAETKGTDPDASLPTDKSKSKSKVEMKGSRVEGGVEVEGPEGKIKGGKIKMPKFQISTKVRSEEAAKSDVETEGGKLKLKLPKFGISPKPTQAEADLELEGGEGKVRASQSKMSMLGISLGKDRKGVVEPSAGASGKLEGHREADSIRKSEKFKIKMPSITIPTPKVDIDFDRGSPKGKVVSPDREAKAEVKGTAGVQIKGELQAPGVSSDTSESWFKMPKLTMPDLTIAGTGRMDGDAAVETQVKMSERGVQRSKVEVGIQGPEVDADGKFQMLMAKMPKVGIDLPTDGSGGGGKAEIEAGADARRVSQDGAGSGETSSTGLFKMPTVEISTPKMGDPSAGVEGSGAEIALRPLEGRGGLWEADADIQLKMPKIELPLFGPSVSKDKSQERSGDRSSTGATAGSSASKTKIDLKCPQVDIGATEAELDVSEGRLSKLKGKMSKFGVELPKVTQQEEVRLATGVVTQSEGTAKGRGASYMSLKADTDSPDAELSGSEGKVKTDKVRKQLFGFSKTSSPKDKGHSKSAGAKGGLDVGTPPEADSSEAKVKMSRVKMPSFGISWSKNKTSEFNGGVEADASRKQGEDWGIQTGRRKTPAAEESGEADSKMKLKLPKVSLAPVKMPTVDFTLSGPGSAVALQPGDASGFQVNGESELAGSQGVIGKIKLPKVEFSSPYHKVKDSELSLQLVKTEMMLSKEDAGPLSSSGPSFKTSSPRVNGGDVRGAKVKGPKITFAAFKKKRAPEEEDPEAANLVTSCARTELALLESSGDAGHSKSKSIVGFSSGKFKGMYSVQGAASALSDSGKGSKLRGTAGGQSEEKDESEIKDKSAKFKLPKFSLGPKSKGVLDPSSAEYQNNIVSELQLEDEESAARHFQFQMPRVGFTTVYHEEHSSEEKIFVGEGSAMAPKGTKQAKAETLTDKSTSI